MYLEEGTVTLTATTATSESAASGTVHGRVMKMLFTQAAGTTFTSTSKLSVTGTESGAVLLSSGQILGALTTLLYPSVAYTGSTGGALTAYTEPTVMETLTVSVIHGTTSAAADSVVVTYWVDGTVI